MLRWRSLRKAYDEEEIISGKIIRRIKGGMIVDLGVVQAFLPGSQLDVRPITDFDICLLYTSPSPRDVRSSRMPSSA